MNDQLPILMAAWFGIVPEPVKRKKKKKQVLAFHPFYLPKRVSYSYGGGSIIPIPSTDTIRITDDDAIRITEEADTRITW